MNEELNEELRRQGKIETWFHVGPNGLLPLPRSRLLDPSRTLHGHRIAAFFIAKLGSHA